MKTHRVTRRSFLKRLGMAGAAATLGWEASAQAKDRPNVILILTDDQGSVDVNCYGAKDIISPNLDKLASRGVRFSQFYVGAPVCSPSRACLMTGRYPQRAQLPTNAWGDRGMPASQVTIAEVLKGAGYRTAIFGKWHLGDVLPLSPNEQGFDEFLGHKVGCIDNYSHYFYWHGPNKHDMWKNEQEYFEPGSFFPDMVVREAERFLEENRERPFFLYLPFNVPHYPMQAEPEFVAMYDDMEDEQRKRYAAFVTSFDDKIGRVLAKVKELGLTKKTLVVYHSDNGHSLEERAFFGGGSAGPYRGHKFTVWEGGVRLPCICSWPGHIPQGEVRDQLVCSFDWFPTIADYCGVPLPDRIIDGKSISSVIASADAPAPRKTMHWESGKMWAVRDGKWKLVSDKGELFLSDLDADVSESINLADDNPDVVARLKALHEAWAKDVQKQ